MNDNLRAGISLLSSRCRNLFLFKGGVPTSSDKNPQTLRLLTGGMLRPGDYTRSLQALTFWRLRNSHHQQSPNS